MSRFEGRFLRYGLWGLLLWIRLPRVGGGTNDAVGVRFCGGFIVGVGAGFLALLVSLWGSVRVFLRC